MTIQKKNSTQCLIALTTLRYNMKQEIINSLNSKFASKRAIAQEKAYRNLQIARKNAKFAELESKVRELSFEVGKLSSAGNNKLAKQKHVEIATLKVLMAEELKKMKMSKANITPQYQCKKCNDTGSYLGKPCECYKKELYELMIASTGSKKDLATFDAFNEKVASNTEQQKQLKQLRAKFESWCKDYPNVSAKTFIICGATGVGKTFLTECVASSMIKSGHLVSFISAFGLNTNFLKFHTTFDSNKQIYYDVLTEPELLVIDDLGTEPILKNVTVNYLCALLSDRFNAGKATIITTNLGLSQLLDRYGERVFSRLANKKSSEMFKITGEDLRLKK